MSTGLSPASAIRALARSRAANAAPASAEMSAARRDGEGDDEEGSPREDATVVARHPGRAAAAARVARLGRASA
jgi:hypothetical protein